MKGKGVRTQERAMKSECASKRSVNEELEPHRQASRWYRRAWKPPCERPEPGYGDQWSVMNLANEQRPQQQSQVVRGPICGLENFHEIR